MFGGISRAAGTEVAPLVADAERHQAAQDDPELFVLVLVLRDDGTGIELDDAEVIRSPCSDRAAMRSQICCATSSDRSWKAGTPGG